MDNYYESIKLELLEKELEIAIAGLKESIGYPKPPVLGNRTTENQVAGGDEVLGWVPIKKEGE